MCLPLAAEGEFALVRQHMEAAIPLLGGWNVPSGDHDIYGLIVDSASRSYDADILRQYLPLAEEAAARGGHLFYQALAARGWGVYARLTGALDESEARLRQALERFAEMDMPWQQARTQMELALTLMDSGNASAARDLLQSALPAFESLRAAPDAARARDLLETL